MESAADRVKSPDSMRRYAHFDRRVSFNQVRAKVTNPKYVMGHSFYPFIHRVVETPKPPKPGDRKWGVKKRHISYASHFDRCIHQYYAVLLNDRYNRLAADLGIDKVAVAYRTNLGLTNIDLAKVAFDYIAAHEGCLIYVTDLENFFDCVDHRYMKKQVRRLFDDGMIPGDYYKVLKHALKFRVWEFESLHRLNYLPYSKSGTKRLNSKITVLPTKEFRRHAKAEIHRQFEGDNGMPQGSALSGVLANVYMMEFDAELQACVVGNGGLYMRYSDDIIVLMPDEATFQTALSCLGRLLEDVPGVKRSESKTNCYRFCQSEIVEREPKTGYALVNGGRKIEYLGFAFDGARVSIRQRTIGRYYNRVYRRVRNVFRGRRRPSKRRVRELYRKVSEKGAMPPRCVRGKKKAGNFISYAKRAQRAFTEQPIVEGVNGHMAKIRRESQRCRFGCSKEWDEPCETTRFGRKASLDGSN